MEVKLTMRQAIQTLRLAGEKLGENKQALEEARATTIGDLIIPTLEKENDELVQLREAVTAQLQFDEVVKM